MDSWEPTRAFLLVPRYSYIFTVLNLEFVISWRISSFFWEMLLGGYILSTRSAHCFWVDCRPLQWRKQCVCINSSLLYTNLSTLMLYTNPNSRYQWLFFFNSNFTDPMLSLTFVYLSFPSLDCRARLYGFSSLVPSMILWFAVKFCWLREQANNYQVRFPKEGYTLWRMAREVWLVTCVC